MAELAENLPEVLDEVPKDVLDLCAFKELGEVYKKDRAEIYASLGAMLISVANRVAKSVGKKTIENMNFKEKFKVMKDLITSAETLHRQERLERGESTENVSVIVAAIKDLKRRSKE